MRATCLLALSLLLPLSAFGAGSFHAPATSAERSLDLILKIADMDEETMMTLPERYNPATNPNQIDYTKLLTKRLMKSLLAHDAATVKRECRNSEHGGPRCAMDTVPLSCIQDDASGYVYKTLRQSGNSATIAYSWPTLDRSSKESGIADYRMVKEGGQWKIDAVNCARHNGDAPAKGKVPVDAF